MTLCIMILALTGVVLNVFKRAESFVIWTFTNFYWAKYNFNIHETEQAILFAVMGLFSIYGAIAWYCGKNKSRRGAKTQRET